MRSWGPVSAGASVDAGIVGVVVVGMVPDGDGFMGCASLIDVYCTDCGAGDAAINCQPTSVALWAPISLDTAADTGVTGVMTIDMFTSGGGFMGCVILAEAVLTCNNGGARDAASTG